MSQWKERIEDNRAILVWLSEHYPEYIWLSSVCKLCKLCIRSVREHPQRYVTSRELRNSRYTHAIFQQIATKYHSIVIALIDFPMYMLKIYLWEFPELSYTVMQVPNKTYMRPWHIVAMRGNTCMLTLLANYILMFPFGDVVFVSEDCGECRKK
jgi:hypothetical protein